MPRSIIGFLILALGFTANGQNSTAKERFAGLFGDSQYQKLLDELEDTKKRDPAYFAKHDFDYLAARAAEKNGDLAFALEGYQSVISRDSAFGPYALKHLTRIMRESGNLALERLFLTEIIFGEEEGIVRKAAGERLVRNYFESNEYELVIDFVENGAFGVVNSDSPNNSRDLHVLLGRAYLETNQPKAAREVFEELIESVPEKRQPDDFALEAVKGLDRIETGNPKIQAVKNLTAVEHKQRADIYQFNRDFEHARLHYDAIVRNHEGNAAIPEAMYQIGRGHVQERNYKEAAPWFERVRNEFKGNKLEAASLYALAGVFANLDKTVEAVTAYENYIVENPDASNIERGYLNIIDAYRDSGEKEKALEWCSKTQSAFKGEKGEAAGLFAEVRIQIAAREWNRALSALERLSAMTNLGGTRIAGGTNKAEAAFLRGLVLEKLDRIPEAVDVFLAIKEGRNQYYGWRASKRLSSIRKNSNKRPAGDPKTEIEISRRIRLSQDKELPDVLLDHLPLPVPDYSESPSKNAIPRGVDTPSMKAIEFKGLPQTPQSLLELGLFDEAAPEIEAALRKARKLEGDSLSDFDDDTAFTLAIYHAKGGYADRAIRFIESKWKKVDRDFPIEDIPKEQALLLYPAPYRDSLLGFATQENVDPRFLLSIMRQESRFQADIKSVAAARGLMQFISNTSNKMANELAIKRFGQNELYDPDTAIRFGAHYIANIFKDFPEKPQAVAASYNGGEDRMARWFKRAYSDDPDQYVPEIIFSQTKDYVYKVMANYRMYRLLYDENLKPRRPSE